MRDNPEVQVNGQFPKQTEITSGAPERKRPYPALLNVLQAEADSRSGPAPRPPWLKATLPGGPNYLRLKALVKELSLHTVCEEARCPNIGECWGAGTLTFMILGRVCTRNCGFCAVTFGKPPEYDGGAEIVAETIRKIREHDPKVGIEVLIPDFRGSRSSLASVAGAKPDVLNHNIETIARLQSIVRPSAGYERSLKVLRIAKELAVGVLTKSGMMLGLGEDWAEIVQTMADLRRVECDILTIGQYLRPSPQHLPLMKYYAPEEFAELKRIGLGMGFRHVEAGPLVRSSYHAERHVPH